jgi:hypothetical protein
MITDDSTLGVFRMAEPLECGTRPSDTAGELLPRRKARRKLAGGGAERNHRNYAENAPRPGRGAGFQRPSRDANVLLINPGGYASLHHRLISTAPPAPNEFASSIPSYRTPKAPTSQSCGKIVPNE